MANLSSAESVTRVGRSANFETDYNFAVNRVNELIAKIFAIGSLFVGIQMIINGWSQRESLIPWAFWPGFLAVCGGQLGLIIGAFWSKKSKFWQLWYAGSIAGVVITWAVAVPVGVITPDYPWIWWGLGLAPVAAFAAMAPWRALSFLLCLELIWFFGRLSPAYGGADFWLDLQDTLLSLLFAGLFGTLVMVVRYQAFQVDLAAARKILLVSAQASAEAARDEKSRLNALVHDKVLTTLILAANAKTAIEREQVVDLAKSAILALNDSPGAAEPIVSSAQFFAELNQLAVEQYPDIRVSSQEVCLKMIPVVVSAALKLATLQAIQNSIKHAGRNARRELHLKMSRNNLKIVIKDNGRGFRMARVPSNRLGIRISIIERVALVGARAYIDSRPGAGTTIILEWQVDA